MSVAEVKAGLLLAEQELAEQQAILVTVQEKLGEIATRTAGVVDGTGHEAAEATVASIRAATEAVEGVIPVIGNAIDQSQSYAASI